MGGGIARGIAHIGVLKVVEKYQIPVECIAATSSGAMIGAAFAAGLEVRLIEEIALRISWGRIIRVAFFRPGLITADAIEELMLKYVGDKDFSELKIPLAVVATDVRSGEPLVIDKGKVSKAVAASSAFPGLFAPEDIGGRLAMDGAISHNLPVEVARQMGANFIIASDVIPAEPGHYLPRDPIQVFSRGLDIVLHKLSLEQRKDADILIEPHYREEDIYPFDLHKAKKLIAAGEAAAQKALRKFRRSHH